MNNSMNVINSFNILNNNFTIVLRFLYGQEYWYSTKQDEPFDRHRGPTDVSHFFHTLSSVDGTPLFSQKKISRNRSAARTTVPRTNSSSNRSFSFKGSPLLQNGGNVTLAYSTIKVQIKGNLKNSSHLSVSFYNVNERNKNFFLKYPSCEISVYYYDNF